MPSQMLKLGAIFNLTLPHITKNNLYMMLRDALLPSHSMRAPVHLSANSMMDMFNIGQTMNIGS